MTMGMTFTEFLFSDKNQSNQIRTNINITFSDLILVLEKVSDKNIKVNGLDIEQGYISIVGQNYNNMTVHQLLSLINNFSKRQLQLYVGDFKLDWNGFVEWEEDDYFIITIFEQTEIS